MYTDNHNHTKHFSSDAKMSYQELIDTCRKQNMRGVAVTEHYEGDYPHDIGEPQIFDPKEYFEASKKWKEYAGDFPLRLGIELGWQKHLPKFYDEMVDRYPFDVVILSNHLYRGKDPYFYRECYEENMITVYSRYIDEMAQMAEDCSNYDIIGHYDYINRYAPYEDPQIRYDHCPEAFDRLFSAIISKGKSLEVNTRSIDKMKGKGFDMTYSLPDPKILSRYYEMGGRNISMGSDSHTKDTLCLLFPETAKYLSSFGFTENTYFVKRQKIGEPLI